MERLIDTPDFWEKVKADFEATYAYCFCHASNDFAFPWVNPELKVCMIDFAKDFVQDNEEYKGSHYSRGYLFSISGTTYDEARAIRLAFLDYMIAKTSAK